MSRQMCVDSLDSITDVLSEHDTRLLRIVREDQDVVPEHVSGARQGEDIAELSKGSSVKGA